MSFTCFEPKGSSTGRRLYIQVRYSVFYMDQYKLFCRKKSIFDTDIENVDTVWNKIRYEYTHMIFNFNILSVALSTYYSLLAFGWFLFIYFPLKWTTKVRMEYRCEILSRTPSKSDWKKFWCRYLVLKLYNWLRYVRVHFYV